jgi:hypothetical protein
MVETISPRMSIGAVDRGDRKVAALGARPVGEVADIIFAAGIGRQLDVVDLEVARIVAVLEPNVVEHEEFRLRADEYGVADAGGAEIRLGALRRRARIARVELAGARIDDVAEEYQHVGGAERVDIGGVEIRLKDHVAFVDRFPSGDGRAVEHEAVRELVLVDKSGNHRQVLPLAPRVGEAEIDPLDLLILDALQDAARVVRHGEISSRIV